MSTTIPHYFPQFVWQLWLSVDGTPSPQPRFHAYDVYENELKEMNHAPPNVRSIFQDFDTGRLDPETRKVLLDAQLAFSQLETETIEAIKDLIKRTEGDAKNQKSIPLSRRVVETLRKYLIFLRFRNSAGYRSILKSLQNLGQHNERDGTFFSAYRPIIVEIHRRRVLRTFKEFLLHASTDRPSSGSRSIEYHASEEVLFKEFQSTMDIYCWRLCDAELCVGLATEEQEFILSDCCFGTLNEGFEEDPQCCDLFFPVLPTLAIYILGTADEHYPSNSTYRQTSRSTVWIDIGFESASDVHLRNAMILQIYPNHLFFSSLRTVALSISSYDEFRWIQEHQDYSRLKQRCRQKFLQETVTKTLVVRGSVTLIDLTDEVKTIGESAICHGSFSDVWKGIWSDPVERRPRLVALKFLRQIMVQNVKEKLLKRLQAEVTAWHGLCHRNVSQLFGIVQTPRSIGMVSPWCDNGTICQYLKNNKSANRIRLLRQVASGIAYLHTFKPVVIHGDLKGGNILIDAYGYALITDFGLSKVMEDMTDSMNMGTSFFAGSTRWMAPELILALVEDDGQVPPITTYSDVYAFASVCLEVASGQLPYPHRTNDHAVIVDILRGVRPSRGATCQIGGLKDEEAFWAMLDKCWTQAYTLRPTMPEMLQFLEGLT